MLMTQATTLSLIFMIAAVIGHYWALGRLMRLMPSPSERHSHFFRSIGILLLLILVHIVEILWFSGSYYLARDVLELGGFTDKFKPIFRDYFYYSLVTYTTLGLSEFSPTGHVKVVTGMEALTGFILLTWSATFFYSLINRQSGQPAS